MIGAFCRTYSVKDAIEKFLSDIYIPSKLANRYTYAKGTASSGLILYENGDFAYSHHGTDPAGGKLCNSFDLVRIHRFGELDMNIEEGTNGANLPSFKAMIEFCLNDDGVRITLGKERFKKALKDFRDEDIDLGWMAELEIDKRGYCMPAMSNINLIFKNDPNLKGKIAFNEFSNRTMIRGDLPWHTLKSKTEGDL